MRKRIGVALLALFVVAAGIEAADGYFATGSLGYVSPAEAIVGRPLTPVSVAGAGRRTVRRCAAGVYYC